VEAQYITESCRIIVVNPYAFIHCQPYAPAALYPEEYSWYSFVRGWVDPRATVRLEGLGQFKNPIASSRIEPATLRAVTLCLNHLRYRVHLFQNVRSWKNLSSEEMASNICFCKEGRGLQTTILPWDLGFSCGWLWSFLWSGMSSFHLQGRRNLAHGDIVFLRNVCTFLPHSHTVAYQKTFFFLFGLWDYRHCGQSWPIVPASGDNEDDCGEDDRM
jgi:hypothetical protein